MRAADGVPAPDLPRSSGRCGNQPRQAASHSTARMPRTLSAMSTGDDRRPAPWKRGLPGWRRSECCRRSTGAPTLCFRWPALRRSPGDHEAGVHAAVLHRTVAAATCACPSSAMRSKEANRFRQNASASYRRPSLPVRRKLPPDSTSPCSANTSGLSETALASISSTSAAGGSASGRRPLPVAGSAGSKDPALFHSCGASRRLRCARRAGGDRRGRRRSGALAAHLMDTRIERAAGAQRRFHRQAARHGRGGEQVFRVEQAAQREGGGDPCRSAAPAPCRQRQRFQAGFSQRFGRRQPLALMARRPSPSSTGLMRQRLKSPEAPTSLSAEYVDKLRR